MANRPRAASTISARNRPASSVALSYRPFRKPISMNMRSTANATPATAVASLGLLWVRSSQEIGTPNVRTMSEEVRRVGGLDLAQGDEPPPGRHGVRHREDPERACRRHLDGEM